MKLIDEDRLKELLIAEAFAEVLERNGVDEWDYYEDALRDEQGRKNICCARESVFCSFAYDAFRDWCKVV